jgi:hypothetical protein
VTDVRAWAKRWNDASRRQIATLREPPPSRRWPLVGMFAVGLVAGAIGYYAVTQRSQIKQLARRAVIARDDLLGDLRGVTAARPVAVTSRRSNHRRKAAVEAT